MKRKLSFRCLIVIFLLSLLPDLLYCQDNERTDNIWLSLGPAFFASDPVSSIALYCGASWKLSMPSLKSGGIKMREHYFRMRIIRGQGSATEDYFLKFTEAGLLYGKSFGSAAKFTVAFGLSAVKGYKSIEYRGTSIPAEESGPFFKAGFPLEIELDLSGKHAGLGICGFADMNSACTFLGAGLVLSFGKLR